LAPLATTLYRDNRNLSQKPMKLQPGSVSAQTLDTVFPVAAEPGDLVTLRGSGFTSPTDPTVVTFTAFVGGFAGVWSEDAKIVSKTATEIQINMPAIGAAFVPGSSPYGEVKVKLGAKESNSQKFFFMEQTTEGGYGDMSTIDVGGTQSTGVGKPVIDFDIGSGEPVAGVAATVLRVQNANPTSLAVLVGGVEAVGPMLPFEDGFLAVDAASLILVTDPAPFTDSAGMASHKMSVPAALAGKTAVVQWGVIDFGLTDFVALSNALKVTL
jgi:hypothetical protein